MTCLAGVAEVWNGQYDFKGLRTSGAAPVILDIGANCGAFSLWASLVHWPLATIHAYEPNPDIFPYLVRNCEPRVQCHNVAVGDTAWTSLHFHPQHPLCASVHPQKDHTAAKSIRTISPLELPAADIIKIDTEGAEFEILRMLPYTPSLLVLEWHGQLQRVNIENILAGRMRLVESTVSEDDTGILKYIRL